MISLFYREPLDGNRRWRLMLPKWEHVAVLLPLQILSKIPADLQKSTGSIFVATGL
jgi:hypothetical protein